METQIDFINNGQAYGDAADALIENGMDVNRLRPYKGSDGRSYITINTGQTDSNGKPVYKAVLTGNAATLRKDEWVRLDTVLLRAKRERLRAYADLRAANTYGGFDGFSTMVIEHERINDPGEAQMDFDALTEGRSSMPNYDLVGLPLPIIHFPFSLSARRLAVSRKMGTPINVTMAEIATRRCMETVEKLTIGTLAGLSLSPKNVAEYAGVPTIYGYTNYPDRITNTGMTLPTAPGWTPKTFVTQVLGGITALQDAGFYGPYMIYHSKNWSSYLDEDYSDAKGDNTLRERVNKTEDVSDVRRLDYFSSGFQIIIAQMTEDVVRAVNGMEFSMVQWDTKGGAQKNFRVMGIQVPQIRSDINGNCGVWHGTAS